MSDSKPLPQITIGEFLEKLPTFSEDERTHYCTQLIMLLCKVSRATILEFQGNWNNSRPYSEFAKEQNKVFVQCINSEISALGKAIREKLDLPPLTKETILS